MVLAMLATSCSDNGANGTNGSGQVKLVSITLAPGSATVPKGTSQPFTATGTFSDNSTQELSPQVAWSTTDVSGLGVATVSAAGLAIAANEGATDITASYMGVVGKASLTVTTAALETLAISPSNPSIAKGTSQQFKVTGTFTDASTQDLSAQVTWGTSDLVGSSVNTVNTSGLATGHSEGTATINASYLGKMVATNLTVTAASLASLAISPSNPSLAKGVSQQFTATGTFSDGTTQNLTAQASFSSMDQVGSNIAVFGVAGLLISKNVGTAQVNASCMGKSGQTGLTVTAAKLTALSLSPSNPGIAQGTSQPFTATGSFSDGSTADLSNQVTWSASDVMGSGVASVSNTGLVQGKAQGVATISATQMGLSGQSSVTVTAAVPTALAISPSNPSLAKGTATNMTATAILSDGSTQNVTNQVAWTTTDTAGVGVASITGAGLVSGNNLGTATVSAVYLSLSAQTSVTVNVAALTGIAISPSNPSLAKGTTQQFNARGTFSDGTTQDITNQVTWGVMDVTGVSVASIGGMGAAAGNNTGTAMVTASFMGKSSTTVLTVTAAILTQLSVNPSNPSIAKGTTQAFVATGKYSDGSTQNVTAQVNWSTSDVTGAGVASIDTAGLALGRNVGTATITASYFGQSTATPLTVTAAVVKTLTLTPPTASIAKGLTQPFSATALMTDGTIQNVTGLAIWQATDVTGTGVASITGGLATAKAVGTTSIMAIYAGQMATATLSVSAAVVTSLAVTPTNPSIKKGTTQQFTATGTLSDGSMQNLTNTVTWSAVNTMGSSVSSIALGGLATANNQGTATITASYLGLSGATTVTVTAPSLVSITLNTGAFELPISTTRQILATGTYSDGTSQNISSSVVWTATDVMGMGVASITANGLLTARNGFQANVTASSQGQTASVQVTVNYWRNLSGTAFGLVPLESVWGSSANDVWVGGNYRDYYSTVGYDYATLAHWNGSTWTNIPTPSVIKFYPISGLTGSASNDVWAASGASILRWDGAAWATSSATYGQHLWLNQNNDVWTESSAHWDGTMWSSVPVGPATSRKNVWGASGNDIWTVGDSGDITHWDGTAWKQITSPTTTNLAAVGGSSSTDVWAMGGGSIIHWNGTTWSPVTNPDPTNLMSSVWASASDSAWAVGNQILYWNGTSWAIVPPGACGGPLATVWGQSRNDVWLVGGSLNGVACHYP